MHELNFQDRASSQAVSPVTCGRHCTPVGRLFPPNCAVFFFSAFPPLSPLPSPLLSSLRPRLSSPRPSGFGVGASERRREKAGSGKSGGTEFSVTLRGIGLVLKKCSLLRAVGVRATHGYVMATPFIHITREQCVCLVVVGSLIGPRSSTPPAVCSGARPCVSRVGAGDRQLTERL